MPWESSDAKKHIKGLNSSQSAAWAKIANSVLAKCKASGGTNCDAKAIRIANSKAKNVKNADDVITETFKLKRIKWKDIDTDETEDGLLVKGIPVFKAGKHRQTKYDEEYIDKKMIGQFDPDEDVPLQADHSDSWKETLGWVKKLYRKGKLLLADLMLVDDNAVARWKKGLMKKWSVSINKETGKLHEISAVAFPYVKEAAIHGDVAEVGMKDYVVEEKELANKPPKKEIIEIDAHAERPDAAHKEFNEDGSPVSDNIVNNDGGEKEENKSTVNTINWADGIDISISSKGTQDTTTLSVDGKKIKKPEDISFSMYGTSVFLRYSKNAKDDNGMVKRISYEYRTPYTDRPVYNEELPASSRTSTESSNGEVRDTQVESNSAPSNQHCTSANNNEDTETNNMSEEKKIDAKELLREASEREEKLSAEGKEKDAKIAKMSEDMKAKEREIAEFKVDGEIAALKADGKITPAQEEKMKEFMLTLTEEARAKFIAVLKEGKPKVDLKEHSSQESKKEEDLKLDLEAMSTDEIEAAIEKYAKKEGIPVEDARDIFYEKNSK